MRLATWNVNSVRARVDRIVDFAVRESVDVLAMQEIKCKAEQFPYEQFEDAGFHVEAHGFSQWNGVAIASREPLTDVEYAFPGMPGFGTITTGADAPQEARAIGATVGGIRVWSLYVPNGRSLGDPHYFYKLDWLSALQQYTTDALARDPGSRARPRRRLQHRADGCRQRRSCRGPGFLDPRLTARARGVRGARGGRPDGRGAPARADRITPTGTTSGCASPGTRACASTSSSARMRSRMPSRARRSIETSARASSRATTCPSWSTSISPRPTRTTIDRPMIFG